MSPTKNLDRIDLSRITDPAILEEMMALAEKAPGIRDTQEVIGDATQTPPVTLLPVTSAGYVWVYRVKDGQPVKINRNMLPTQLRKTDPDDPTKRAFSIRRPDVKPRITPTLACLLHPKNPDRAKWDEMGLPTCSKVDLASPYQVEAHMRAYHHTEFRTIEADRIAREKAEDRALQQSLVTAVRDRQMAPPVAAPAPVSKIATGACPTCGLTIMAKNQTGVALKMKAHLRKKHKV